MLVLSRKQGESVVLNTSDGEIEVVMLETKGSRARIGFTAPESVKIVRKELQADAGGKSDERPD